MKSKDVVFLCQFFYPEYISSALLPYQTAKYLAEQGMKVSAISGYPKEYLNKSADSIPVRETIDNIEISRVKYLQLSRDSKIKRMVNYISFVVMMFSKLFEIGKHRIIIVYSNPPILPIIALFSKKLFKSKIIFVSYDIYPEIAIRTNVIQDNSLSTKIMKWINLKLFKNADLIIALSNEMKNEIVKLRNIEPDIVCVIENWATEEDNNYEYIKNRNNNSEGKLVISYLGNMGIPQDLETIIAALNDNRIKNNPQLEFIFAGHGNKKEKLKDFVMENKISNVRVYDYLIGDEYQQVINETDILLLSLKKELTGLAVPSKFYTYTMMKKYILGIIDENTDIAKNIKKLKMGASVNNFDIESFIEIILFLSNNPSNLKISKDIYNNYFSKAVQLPKYYKKISKLLK